MEKGPHSGPCEEDDREATTRGDDEVLALRTKITVGGGDAADLLKQASKGLRQPREYLKRVGVLGMSSAVTRLGTVLRQDEDAVRTGRLANSLRTRSIGSADNIFELSEARVEVGSNVPYAAQVHHGGTILPKTGKAIAIPLDDKLKKAGLWPRDLDPSRELLKFVPITGMKPNIVGVLVDEGEDRSRTIQAGEFSVKSRLVGNTPYGPGVLYAIAYWVTQPARPYLYWSDEDVAETQRLFRKWIGWEN